MFANRLIPRRFALLSIFGLLVCGLLLVSPLLHGDTGNFQPKVQALWKQGEGDYHTYRIPSLIKTTQGTLLAFCEARKKSASDAGKIDLVMRRSEDGGKSWSDQQVVWEDGDNTCGNPCPVVDESTGAIWLLLTHNLGQDNEKAIKAKTAEGTRTVWVSHSDDDGKSWTDPIEITSTTKNRELGWYATGPGVGIQIKNGPYKGRLVIPCDHSYDVDKSMNSAGYEFGSHVIFSDDHGKTWQLGGTIRPKMNECQVIEVGDSGELVIDMRSYRGQGCRAQARSTDGGLTWTDPEDVRQLVSPVCQASIIRLTAPADGERQTLVFSSPGDPGKRINLTLRVSHDEGKDWSQAIPLYAGPTAYSCLEILPDGSVACLAEIGERSPYQTISLLTVPAQKIQPLE